MSSPGLSTSVADGLRDQLADVAEQTVAAVIAEVPSYADAFTGEMGATIEQAVRMALGGFLNLASRPDQVDPSAPLQPALAAAYDLGRGEARAGRTVIALLSAYRVGARVSWRGLARAAVGGGLGAEQLAGFAELVFAYIDQLSAASVAGHADELATTGYVLQRYRDALARVLLDGATEDELAEAADRAGWAAPETLTAVLLPPGRGQPDGLDPRTLRFEPDDQPGTVLLVPDPRERLLRRLVGGPAVVGPTRPWRAVRSSYLRAQRSTGLPGAGREVVDTDAHLTELVLGADPEALQDLRARVLEPLAGLRPDTARKLEQTLRSWLLNRGRREDVAAALFVHPQTVRYRMGQLRELYGERLDDAEFALQLTVALALEGSAPSG